MFEGFWVSCVDLMNIGSAFISLDVQSWGIGDLSPPLYCFVHKKGRCCPCWQTFSVKPCIQLFLHLQLPTLPPAPGRYDSTRRTFSKRGFPPKRKPAGGAMQAQRGCCPKLLTRQSPALWDKGLRSFAETRECRRLLSSGRGKRKTCGLFWHADKREERGELV